MDILYDGLGRLNRVPLMNDWMTRGLVPFTKPRAFQRALKEFRDAAAEQGDAYILPLNWIAAGRPMLLHRDDFLRIRARAGPIVMDDNKTLTECLKGYIAEELGSEMIPSESTLRRYLLQIRCAKAYAKDDAAFL